MIVKDILQREAYLEVTNEPFESVHYLLDKVRNYVSGREGLNCRIIIRGNPEDCSGSVSIYPVTGAEDVLEITNEISNLMKRDVYFNMRPVTEKN